MPPVPLSAIPPRGRRSALVIVDVQNDFCPPNGSLAVNEGNEIIPVVNKLREEVAFNMVIRTQDWHPEGHVSFLRTHLATKDLDLFQVTTTASGNEQVMWPEHCLQNSKGAEFHPDLVVKETDVIIQKGSCMDVDSYSGFFDNDHLTKTELTKVLHKNNITDVYIAGLALDYCVGFTALDARREGFTTFVIQDATRGVMPETSKAMLTRMEEAGVNIISSSLVLTQGERHDSRRAAAHYLEQNKIHQLFENLCAQLVFHRPDNPREFLIEQLRIAQKAKSHSAVSMFESKDYEALFNMLDPLGKGSLPGSQVASALPALGLDLPPNFKAKEAVPKDEFVKLLNSA